MKFLSRKSSAAKLAASGESVLDIHVDDMISDSDAAALTALLEHGHSTGSISMFSSDVDSDMLQATLGTEGYADIPLSEEGKRARDAINSFLVPTIKNIVDRGIYLFHGMSLLSIFTYVERSEQNLTPAQRGFVTAFCNCFQEDFLTILPCVPGSTIPLEPERKGADMIKVRGSRVSGLHTDDDSTVLTVSVPFGKVPKATPVISNRHKDKFNVPRDQDISHPITVKPKYKNSRDTQFDVGRGDCARVVAGDGWVKDGIKQGVIHGMPFPEWKTQELKEHGKVKVPGNIPRCCLLSTFIKQQRSDAAAGAAAYR